MRRMLDEGAVDMVADTTEFWAALRLLERDAKAGR